ncbi:MAG: hypothetical protein HY291_10995, partial [Planctomycetes bacterium]|nr:hypothetical protein [Planctomycetota bacterium]
CDAEQRTRTIFALERPPGIQPVRYKPVSTKEDVLELKLAWPRTLWFCLTSQAPNTELASIMDLWVTVTKAPIQPAGTETALYCLPMPNIYDNGCGAVCFGNLRLEDSSARPRGIGRASVRTTHRKRAQSGRESL